MSHHLEALRADGIHNLGALFCVSNLQLLLQKNRRLLIGRLDNARDEKIVRRGRRRMKQRKEVDRLL